MEELEKFDLFAVKNKIVLFFHTPEQKKSALIIPNSKEKPQFGEVLAIGGEVKEIFVGDKVAVGNYAGQKVIHNDLEYTVVTNDEVLCVIRK